MILKKMGLVEKFAWSCIMLSWPYFFVFRYFGFYLAGNMILFFLVLFAVPIVLNRWGKPNVANFSLIFVGSVLLFFYSLILGKNSGAYLVFISLVPLPVLLYNDLKKIVWILTSASVPVIFTYGLEFIDYRLYFEQAVLTGMTERVIHGFALSTAFSFALTTSYLFYTASKHNIDLLTQSNEELTQSNARIRKSYLDLQEGKDMAERLKVQADYASMVKAIAHEIKNPLIMLRSRSEIVLQKLDNKESIQKFAEVIVRNSDRLYSLVNTMLTYGAPVTKERQIFDLTEVLEHLSILMEASCFNKQIKVVKEFGDVLPVIASKDLVEQALLNIVSNAIQYTPQGGQITLGLTLGDYHDPRGVHKNGVQVKIQDTGCGIKKELIQGIFEPYVSSKVVGANLGLGLAFVYRVVGENDGKLFVETELGKGTSFFVTLPLAEQQPIPDAIKRES
jgi:signal transduction histidine kinase